MERGSDSYYESLMLPQNVPREIYAMISAETMQSWRCVDCPNLSRF